MELDEDEYVPEFQPTTIKHNQTIYDCIPIGNCILYDYNIKRFFPKIYSHEGVFVGQFLNIESDICNVLYKGFFLKDLLTIKPNINDQYVQIYLKKEFESYRNGIINRMPCVKRLKRMNLKMITRELTYILYDHLNNIGKEYEKIYGYDAAQIYKANLVTTPFFVNDHGIIKLYSMETNELKDADIESSGNFLSYFSYNYLVK